MALTPQSDLGDVVGANSYVTLAEFKAYHDARGNVYSGSADPVIEAAIVRGTDYLETRFRFKGAKLNATQTTEWPRKANVTSSGIWCVWGDGTTVSLIDNDGNEITGIPDAVKRASFEYAIRALGIPLFQDKPAPEGGKEIDEHTVKVDVIEESTKYAPTQPGAFAIPVFPQADLWLLRAGLIESGRVLYR